MKKKISVLSVLVMTAFMMMQPVCLLAGEHGGQEHGGKEHGGSHGDAATIKEAAEALRSTNPDLAAKLDKIAGKHE